MAKPSMTFKFNIDIHGIRKHCPKYYFKCVVKKCGRSFNKIKGWNTHHHIVHRTKLKCGDCGKYFATPSLH